MPRRPPASVRTALVTGGNRGLGFEVCRQLGRLGMRVVLTARTAAKAKVAAAKLHADGLDVLDAVIDAREEASVRACAAGLSRLRVRVDVLINNAAIYPPGGVLKTPSRVFRETLDANLLGALWTVRAFVPAMQRAGYGRVVNVSSDCGSFGAGLRGPAAYCISKAALNALTVKLAQEVVGDLKVNALNPGWVRTRMGGRNATRTPAQGADTVIWLATLPADGLSGGLFQDRKPLPW